VAKTSTNALMARYERAKGHHCETVQRFYGGKRHDLFGFADSVSLSPAGISFIQNCSYGTLKPHRDAVGGNGAALLARATGAMVTLSEWRKKKIGRQKRWQVRFQHMTDDDGSWGPVSDWEEMPSGE
jgi:hypothetical protein